MFVSVLSPKKSRLHSARIIAVPTKVLTKYDQQASFPSENLPPSFNIYALTVHKVVCD